MKFSITIPILGIFILLLSGCDKMDSKQEIKEENKSKYKAEIVPAKMTVQEKKARFIALVQPAVQKVHAELTAKHKKIKADMKAGTNRKKIAELKEKYKVETDTQLLMAIKPHRQSIALAQAALESSWATSRFFVKAKNIFGMWSVDPNEPRIAASEKRGGTRTIWLKKFDTIEDSVRSYFILLGRGKAYKEFRQVRYTAQSPFKTIEKLDKYSEIGDKYAEELGGVIRYNKLTRFDNK